MKKIITISIIMLSFVALMAQGRPERNGAMQRSQRPSFEQFMAEKTQFMLAEMKLPQADSAKFVPVFQELQKAKGELMRRYGSMRETYMRIRRNEQIADSLYIKAVMNESELQVADARLEQEYLVKFSKVLTPKQLFDYNEANKKFKNSFMNRPRSRHK